MEQENRNNHNVPDAEPAEKKTDGAPAEDLPDKASTGENAEPERPGEGTGPEPAEEKTDTEPEEEPSDAAPAEEKEDAPAEEADGEKAAAVKKDGAPAKKKAGQKPAGKKPAGAAKKPGAPAKKSGAPAKKKTGGAPPSKRAGAAPGGAKKGAKPGVQKSGPSSGKKGAAASRYPGRPAVDDSRSERVRISAERRKKKKRRRDTFIVCLLLLMLGAILVILSTTVFFKAGKVIVGEQTGRYADELIVEASGLRPGENMFTADLKKAENAVEQKLPYIRVAAIHRRWPDTFVIDAEYAEMILAVRKGGAYAYIDIDGKVLETDVTVPDGSAALVTGVYADVAVPGERVTLLDGKTPDTLIGIARGLYENGISLVTGINIENPTDVVVELDHRIEVKFGPVSSFADRIEFGKTVIEKNMKEGSAEKLVIDLTTEAKAFVRTKQEPTTRPATGTDAASGTPTDADEDWIDDDEDYDDYDDEDYDDYDDEDEDYDEDYDGDYDGDYDEDEDYDDYDDGYDEYEDE